MAPPKKLPAPLVGIDNAEPPVKATVEQHAPVAGFVPLVPNTVNEVELEILRFKTDVRAVKRNAAWKKGQVDIEEIEHRHYWDSHNRAGIKNAHCVARNGHTHAMSYELSSDGKQIKITCGPAVREASKAKPGGGSKRVYDKIFLHMEDDEVEGGQKPVYDNHIHEVTYMKTETILVRSN